MVMSQKYAFLYLYSKNKIINILEPILIVFILIIITSYAVDNSYNPFLYFRF